MERKSTPENFEVETIEDQRTGLENIVLSLMEYNFKSSQLLSFDPTEVLGRVEEVAKILQSQRVTKELQVFLESKHPSRCIEVDLPGFLDNTSINSSIPGAVFISHTDFSNAKARGIATATDYIFSLFSPTIPFSFGKRKIPYLPWRRDMAEQYLVKEIVENTDQTIYSLPTKIPGVTVDFYYNQGEDFPDRSLFLMRE